MFIAITCLYLQRPFRTLERRPATESGRILPVKLIRKKKSFHTPGTDTAAAKQKKWFADNTEGGYHINIALGKSGGIS